MPGMCRWTRSASSSGSSTRQGTTRTTYSALLRSATQNWSSWSSAVKLSNPTKVPGVRVRASVNDFHTVARKG